MSPISSTLIYAMLICFSIVGLTGCEKESSADVLRRTYPIPTELPEATCEGKNTIGCYVDSILFVANYFPNTSSWGSPTYDGGVRAFIEKPEDDYINIIAEHPIRPHEIDNRWMKMSIWYWPLKDSIGHISFFYIGNGFDYSVKHNHVVPTPAPLHKLTYDSAHSQLCGVISYAKLAEYNPQDFGDPHVRDTLILRDLRLDLLVYMERY